MGKDKKKTESRQQTTPSFAPGEQQFQQRQMASLDRLLPITEGIATDVGQRVGNILKGERLPGFLGGLQEGITPDIARNIAGEAVSFIAPSLQKQGLVDSGVRAELETQTAGDIFRQAFENNLNRQMQILGMGFGAAPTGIAPAMNIQQLLGQRFAGLRPVSGTGTQTSTYQPSFMSSVVSPAIQGLSGGFGYGLGGGIGTGLSNFFYNPQASKDPVT